jgi:hypothetical protein
VADKLIDLATFREVPHARGVIDAAETTRRPSGENDTEYTAPS